MLLEYISGKYRYPYIYIILKSNYIYIGETQTHPSIRWSSHLKENGSFSVNLRRKNEYVFSQTLNMHMYSIKCDEIVKQYTSSEYKNATQYLEHQLHVLFSTNRKSFSKNLIIISNTDKTLPKYPYRFKKMKEYAKEIFNNLITELNNIVEEEKSRC